MFRGGNIQLKIFTPSRTQSGSLKTKNGHISASDHPRVSRQLSLDLKESQWLHLCDCCRQPEALFSVFFELFKKFNFLIIVRCKPEVQLLNHVI